MICGEKSSQKEKNSYYPRASPLCPTTPLTPYLSPLCKGAKHELLMYSIDSITANLEKVDMGQAAKLFDNKVVEEQIKRPES